MSELTVEVTDSWREAFPEAHVGLVVLDDVSNPPTHAALEAHIRSVEDKLRQQFAGADRRALAALPVVEAYHRHYRPFGQTYHVLRQLESVALKGRPLASRGALVMAMFAAELESLLLTAGHDLDLVQPPLVVDRSIEGDCFVGIGGQEQAVRAGDMLMRDAAGIISAVLYGPDERTRLNEKTGVALFTTYAPRGIEPAAVLHHLKNLVVTVQIAVPSASVRKLALYPAASA